MILLTPILALGEERYFVFSLSTDKSGALSVETVFSSSAESASKSVNLLMPRSGHETLCRGVGIAIGSRITSLCLPAHEIPAMPLAVIIAAGGHCDTITNSILSGLNGNSKIPSNRRNDHHSSN